MFFVQSVARLQSDHPIFSSYRPTELSHLQGVSFHPRDLLGIGIDREGRSLRTLSILHERQVSVGCKGVASSLVPKGLQGLGYDKKCKKICCVQIRVRALRLSATTYTVTLPHKWCGLSDKQHVCQLD
jgi:hypothetical protein